MLNAEFIKQYDTPGEKPYYTTHADGLYYSMCHTYGGFEYNLSVSGTLEQINHLYSTDTVDIIRINANERFATWGERSQDVEYSWGGVKSNYDRRGNVSSIGVYY